MTTVIFVILLTVFVQPAEQTPPTATPPSISVSPINETVDHAIGCGIGGLLFGCGAIEHVSDNLQQAQNNRTMIRRDEIAATQAMNESDNNLLIEMDKTQKDYDAKATQSWSIFWTIFCVSVVLAAGFGLAVYSFYDYKKEKSKGEQQVTVLMLQMKLDALKQAGVTVVPTRPNAYRLTAKTGRSAEISGGELLKLEVKSEALR